MTETGGIFADVLGAVTKKMEYAESRTNQSNRLIFHIDVNCAFLSWEAVRRVKTGEADLREIPSAIGGNPEKRTGIILAKSIPAKAYAKDMAETIFQDYKQEKDLHISTLLADLMYRGTLCQDVFLNFLQKRIPERKKAA